MRVEKDVLTTRRLRRLHHNRVSVKRGSSRQRPPAIRQQHNTVMIFPTDPNSHCHA